MDREPWYAKLQMALASREAVYVSAAVITFVCWAFLNFYWIVNGQEDGAHIGISFFVVFALDILIEPLVIWSLAERLAARDAQDTDA